MIKEWLHIHKRQMGSPDSMPSDALNSARFPFSSDNKFDCKNDFCQFKGTAMTQVLHHLRVPFIWICPFATVGINKSPRTFFGNSIAWITIYFHQETISTIETCIKWDCSIHVVVFNYRCASFVHQISCFSFHEIWELHLVHAKLHLLLFTM